MSGDFIDITSETGETSSLAATRGSNAFPNADAPAIMCVYLNCFWAPNINGVKLSAVSPLKASLSATRSLDTPPTLDSASEA